jgi:hypothetical protein
MMGFHIGEYINYIHGLNQLLRGLKYLTAKEAGFFLGFGGGAIPDAGKFGPLGLRYPFSM